MSDTASTPNDAANDAPIDTSTSTPAPEAALPLPEATAFTPDGALVEQRLTRQVTDPADARRRLAEATRSVIHHLVASSVSDELLEDAVRSVEHAAAALDAGATAREYVGASEGSLIEQGRDFIDYSPLMGWLNPLAPPMDLWHEAGKVLGTVTFGPQFEGPPGCVHGGFVAAAFDEILGVTQSLSGTAGMTGRLEVNYRTPTPLGHELHFVGWVDRIEGRKIFASATLHVGERLCAEATGLFVSMRPNVMDRLLRLRAHDL